MPAQITLVFDHTPEGVDEAAQIIAKLNVAGPTFELMGADAPTGDGEQKPKRGRKPRVEPPAAPAAAPAEQTQTLATAPADPLAMLGLGAGAGTLPPTAAAPAPAPQAAPTPAPAPQPSAQVSVDQKTVIGAFVKLGQTPPPKGGPDAIRKVLGQFGAATVTAIKPEQYAQAVAAVQQALSA